MRTATRRRFLVGAGCLALGAGLARSGQPARAAVLPEAADPVTGRVVALDLVAAERPQVLPCFDGLTLPMWTFAADTWLPVVRIALGDRLVTRFENRLPRAGEHSSIHWHGIRLPNDQDGVPYLVQQPVDPGGSFTYDFTPPDTGTFFFHTHCNTVEQMGRGLMGILIVEGDAVADYAADEVVLLRDWRVDRDAGAFSSFFTPRGASRAGSYGNVRSANGAAAPQVVLPAGRDARLRLINGDPTRLIDLGLDGAEAAVIAIDGVAVTPMPFAGWLLGSAMRIDLAVRAPAAGASAMLVDRRGAEPLVLATITGAGAAPPASAFDPVPLRGGRMPVPDLAAAAGTLAFDFAAGAATVSPDAGAAGAFMGTICVSSEDFWTINGAAWPGRDHARIPAPLAVLERDRSYRVRLRNPSQIAHPVHIHGHHLTVLRSDQRSLPVHHADTVLLLPNETVEAAFVADNPGDWMFHCHVIEHQETGMMGYVRVL
jgi:FtsP/CotA-like multicopper oxidase with cupredoxin domain